MPGSVRILGRSGPQPLQEEARRMPDAIQMLRESVCKVYLGNRRAVDRAICTLLARGHLLIEDVPGVGKTVLATALARSIDCSFSRIQLTPDLLPTDILGVTVFVRDHAGGTSNGSAAASASAGAGAAGSGGGGGRFEFRRGPIFANVVLADEINRTPPRTQTALLEAMAEGTVTVDGRTYPLERPFMIIATQNPYDFEGTYPLPENQLDRFFMRIGLGYPSAEEEINVLSQRPAEHALQQLAPALSVQDVRALQDRVDHVKMDRTLTEYIVAFAASTRKRSELQVGLSPRGSLALAQAARATAVMSGRDYVIPEDITENVLAVCAHRVQTRGYTPVHAAAIDHSEDADDRFPPGSPQAILMSVLESVASPV